MCSQLLNGVCWKENPVSWVVPHWQHRLTSATQLPNVPIQTNKCHYHNPVIDSSLLRPIMSGQLWFLQQRWLKHKTNQPLKLWQQSVGLFERFCWFLAKEEKKTTARSASCCIGCLPYVLVFIWSCKFVLKLISLLASVVLCVVSQSDQNIYCVHSDN